MGLGSQSGVPNRKKPLPTVPAYRMDPTSRPSNPIHIFSSYSGSGEAAVMAPFAVREVDGMNPVDLKQKRKRFRQENDRWRRL